LRERAIKNVVDERGFAGTRDAGDDSEQAERQRDVDILEIVALAPRIEWLCRWGCGVFPGRRFLRRRSDIDL